MPKVVLDTVVFVRGLINPAGRWGDLLFARAEAYRLVVSRPIVEEVLDVLFRSGLSRKFRVAPTRDVSAVITLLAQAEVVEPASIPPVCRDPKDDKFLAAAAAANADYLVTEDQDLLVLGAYHGTRIVDALTLLRDLRSQFG